MEKIYPPISPNAEIVAILFEIAATTIYQDFEPSCC